MPKHRKRNYRIGGVAALAALVFISATVLAPGQTAVTTYHYDNYRTGWNRNETVLTPANVGKTTFGLLQTVPLDDQVDLQPLVVPGVQITAGNYQGQHDVVYVATENNTVYAIDVHTGTVLLSPNFGTPVAQASLPGGRCNANGPNVGITSTPVIDPTSNTLYVMVYTQGLSGKAYMLHALDLGSLTDKVTPQTVTASQTLTNGTIFNFNANYQRQRPALLLANGSIYAGFGSFCDKAAKFSRGWLLGWTAGSLAPFPSNHLNNLQATGKYFLSSIWMAGYGPAADDEGNILFVTGNSEAGTYDGVTNIQESVAKVSNTLTAVLDLFTPYNQASLDQAHEDFGSGGVLVLPDQPGSTPHLAVAAGKDGTMYLMNEDNLGGYSPAQNNVLASYSVGRCWCGQSYFVDPADGLGRVVTSGGRKAMIWKVQTSPTVALTRLAVSPNTGGGPTQDPGFFTTISSNGNSNPIIWALSRPPDLTQAITLFAFDPEAGGSTLKTLFSGTAGSWPNLAADANLVPVVANGLVFVASNHQLQIFGLTGASAKKTTKKKQSAPARGKHQWAKR
jgi:outer membrane protein assembly factor BamB